MIRKTVIAPLLLTLVSSADTTDIEELSLNVFQGSWAQAPTLKMTKLETVRKYDLEKAAKDTAAGDWIGACSMLGSLLWMFFFLYYQKTNWADVTMAYSEPPLAWFWTKLMDTRLGWTAASYFAFFWSYLVVSVVEFIGWSLYVSGDQQFFGVWAVVSTYGTFILYIVPVIFILLQLMMPEAQGGLTSQQDAGYMNAVVLAIMGIANWLFQWIVHLVFTDRLLDHISANKLVMLKDLCSCEKFEAPAILDEQQAAAFKDKAFNGCYSKLLNPQCQQLINASMYSACSKDGEETDIKQCKKEAITRCSVEREEGLPDDLYYTKCNAFALVDGSVDTFQKGPEEEEEAEEAEESVDDLLEDNVNESDF